MLKVKRIIANVLGIMLILAGIWHIIKPEAYAEFIPHFIPETFANITAAIVELTLGIGVFIPKYRKPALLGVVLLMIAFLPIHIADLFKDEPAIGSQTAAIIRVPIQFVLIYLVWFAQKK